MGTMQIKFEGQTHSIDASTLIMALTRYQAVVEEANRQLSGGAREVTLKVNALKEGSFIIDFSIVQSIVRQLFSRDAVGYIAELVGAIGGVYALYEKFKGKPVREKKDLEKVSLTVKGDVNVAVNIYNKKDVRRALSETVKAAMEDASVSGFSVKGEEGNPCAIFERETFAEYVYDDFENEESIPEERTTEEDATLVITGLSFEKGRQWQFVYNGFLIRMPVKEGALMDKIDKGERFGKGDAIRVRLRCLQHYDKSLCAYINKSYRIVEFHEHIIPEEPGSLFKEMQNE